MSRPLYFDYAATTPVDPTVAERMWAYLGPDGDFGNPGSSSHDYGTIALDAIEYARAEVAALINAEPRELIWTSGATEANNLALKGVARGYRAKGRHIITCKTEHKAVLDVCRELDKDGGQVSYLDPEPDGTIALDRLAAELRPDTVLVSLMHVNNEIGVVHDLATIGALCRRNGTLLHVDAAQGAGKLPLDVDAMQIDLLSLCAHKIYGPKGIGALYVRRRPKVRLQALLHGGGQERGLRAGTLPTHQIVGFGAAAGLAQAAMADEAQRLDALRQRLWQGLQALPDIVLNGSVEPGRSSPGILNVSFAGIAGEALLMALQKHLAVSSGSACTSASQQPSHVLKALGVAEPLADSAIRFSVGRYTRQQDVDRAVDVVKAAVTRLREISPLWVAR